MRTAKRRFAFLLAVCLAQVAAGVALPDTNAALDSGLAGSGRGRMQPVNIPARAAFIAQVPGRSGAEAWAIGLSLAPIPEWDLTAPGGQVVFMRYTPATGWTLHAPLRDRAGKPLHRPLTALALAANGEGWAVGEGGTIVHHRPGGDWRLAEQSGVVTTRTLSGIALGTDASGVYGFAVGDAGTVLRLTGGAWTVDQAPNEVLPDYVGVALGGRDVAWAIGGANSARSLDLARRTPTGWQPLPTGRPMFDGPMPAKTESAVTNTATIGAAAVIAGDTVWFGGRLQPLDPAKPFGDDLIGVSSRPFALRLDINTNAFTSYCPRYHSLGSAGGAFVSEVCDEPFPLSGFEVTSMSAFGGPDGGEVFAGGLGLFHYRGGRWVREPNTNGYLSSVAFATPGEGWVATSGAAFGAGGAAQSTSMTVGHWTTKPARARAARWPQVNSFPLEAVALAPDGSGRGIAVGQDGATVFYEPGADGWDILTRITDAAIHGVAWPEAATGWAVGERGLIMQFSPGARKWAFHAQNGELSTSSLYAVAFSSPDRGYAVGQRGTILRYDGSSWSVDAASRVVTRSTLFALAYRAGRFVAVGADGTVIENTGAGWRAVKAPRARGRDLFAVSVLDDGRTFVAGQRGTVLARAPGGSFEIFPASIDATILSLAAGRDNGGRLHLYASVSPELHKFNGDRLESANGWLMHADERGWRDIEFSHYRTVYQTTDTAAPHDATYAIALEPGGTAGWAVGGTPSQAPDADLHLFSRSTASAYRIDLDGDPRPPQLPAFPELPADGFTFAFFGESGCGQGLCGLATGSGPRADLVALHIQEEVNRLSALPTGPAFAMFGGNMRRMPLPEELGQFRAYLDDFRVPAFAAIGSRDLLAGPESASGREATPSNQYYLDTFAGRGAPWGSDDAPNGIRPVVVPGSPPADETKARTHYAFDYMKGSRARARVVVVDSSSRSLGTAQNQNPPEDQSTWLSAVLSAAKAAGIPSFVVSNVPTEDPTGPLPQFIWDPGQAAAFYSLITAQGVTAVLQSHLRMNSRYDIPAAVPGGVPFYIFGGGGAPLDGTKVAEDGFYHSWQLVTVPDQPLNLLGQAPIRVQSFPALESIALRALKGRSIKAGNYLEFEGLGRIVEGGGPTDPDQSKGTYVRFGVLDVCAPGSFGEGSCAASKSVRPTYRFWSEDPTIAQFVQVEPGSLLPIKRNGEIVVDDQTGILCTFKAGTTYINMVSGFHRARTKITVTGGEGPCIDTPAPDLPVVKGRVETAPAPAAEPAAKPKPLTFRPVPPEPAIALFPPPPAPAVAPAPPAAPGAGKKEEHEVEYETERDKYDFTALPLRRRNETDPWIILGTVALLSFMGAATAAAAVQRRRSPVPRRVWSR